MSNELREKLIIWALLAFKVFCGTIIFFALTFTLWAVGPEFETRWMPVVSKLKITSITENDEGNAVIRAEFQKLRNCEYVGLSWFRGKPDGSFERVSVVLLRHEGDTSSPNRPLGTQRAGPWIIGMPPAEIPGNSFAKLHHRCHGLWLTTTDFYP